MFVILIKFWGNFLNTYFQTFSKALINEQFDAFSKLNAFLVDVVENTATGQFNLNYKTIQVIPL